MTGNGREWILNSHFLFYYLHCSAHCFVVFQSSLLLQQNSVPSTQNVGNTNSVSISVTLLHYTGTWCNRFVISKLMMNLKSNWCQHTAYSIIFPFAYDTYNDMVATSFRMHPYLYQLIFSKCTLRHASILYMVLNSLKIIHALTGRNETIKRVQMYTLHSECSVVAGIYLDGEDSLNQMP